MHDIAGRSRPEIRRAPRQATDVAQSDDQVLGKVEKTVARIAIYEPVAGTETARSAAIVLRQREAA